MVKSKYNRLQLFLIVFVSLFFIFIAVVLLRIEEDKHTSKFKNEILPYIFPVFGIYMTYIFFKRSPIISFKEKSITTTTFIFSKEFNCQTIDKIFLSNKEYYSVLLIFGQYLEATTISFNDNSKIILWNDMYSNLTEIRQYLSEKLPDKIQDPKPKILQSSLKLIGEKEYKGNLLTSFNGLLFIGFCLFILFLLINKHPSQIMPYAAVFFPCAIFFIGIGLDMHYFILDNDVLIIKNHFFLWKEKKISVYDIEELVVESPFRRSDALRIITKKFQSKKYGAGTLRNKHWRELRDDMQMIGIPFRADTYIG